MATIERVYDTVSDPRIYGNRIATYTIDGKGGDFADVLAYASFKQSYAIEAATSAFTKTVKMRQEKVNAIGDALATLSEALASMPSSGSTSDRKSSISGAALLKAKETLSYYGICTLSLDSNNQISYAEATRRQSEVQTAVDTENNDLQQAMSLLSNFITRRDNAFKTASRIISKDDSTASSTIRSIGA